MPKISIIVPCYNEEAVLPAFYDEITRVAGEMAGVEFELVFIDDGSRDKTLVILRELSRRDKRVRFVSFSRNFGKEAGMLAGLRAATGDYVALMDADLQHPPAMLLDMYSAVTEEGYDCAAARRTSREGEPPIRSFFSRMFHKLIGKISSTDFVDGACDFRLMRRSVVDAVLSLPESNRFSKGIFGWVGFQTKWIPFHNVERAAGETKWSFWKLFLYSLEGIVSFSTAPLAIATVLGILLCVIALVCFCVGVIRPAPFDGPSGGWRGVLYLTLFLNGIQLLCIGILGQYLAKTYMEAKNRPVYVVKETEEGVK